MDSLDGLNILIVDDNYADVFFIEELLLHSGFSQDNIYKAHTLSGCIEMTEKYSIDVVLLDLFLPDSTGYDTFDEVNNIVRDTTIIIMSGLSDKEVALNVVKSGAQDFLLKGDFDDKLLLKSITYSIERRKNIELLKQSEHKYRILFEDSPLPMFIVDADTMKIQIVNSAAIDKYGYLRDEFENILLEELIEDEAISKIEKLDESSRKLNLQCNQKIKNGKEIITNTNVNLINVNTKRAYLFLSEDITERILFEKNKLALTSNIQDVERKNLSMELHDGIAQELVLLNIYTDQLKEKFQDELINKFQDILQNTMTQTRRLSYNISPPDLDNGFFEGLKNMFERLSSVNEIKIILDWSIEKFKNCNIESEIGYNIFRIIQEFLNNSLKHSDASTIILRVDRYESEIYFDIQDNGVGFDMSDENNWGLGIRNIKQRAKLHQINYSFLSKINEGTRLSFNIPLENKPLLNNNFSA